MGLLGDTIRKFNVDVKARQDALVREVLTQVASSVLNKSPVGDPALWKNPKSAPPGYEGGKFKGNWNLGVDEIDGTTTEDIDPDGTPTLDKIVGKIPKEAAGHNYFITNSLPYAIPLENGHSSKQAPLGMVTLTIIEFSDIFSRAMLKVTSVNGRSIEF